MFGGDWGVIEIAVSDTGPPLHLIEIDQIHCLTLFERLVVSEKVRDELDRFGVLERVLETTACRLVVEPVARDEIDRARQFDDTTGLSEADLSVVALASRSRSVTILTDDMRLRRALEARGMVVVGCVGILVRAFRLGRMNRTRWTLRLTVSWATVPSISAERSVPT